nr:ARID DNA-binding domain-containing protein [Tanacetum cinerariifolium]
MVHYKRIMQHNWLGYKPVQHWYQSHGLELWEKPIHKHDQVIYTRRYLQRETPKKLFPWNSRKKCLSPESKEMLVKRMKEVEAFNASKMSAKSRDHAKKIASTRKEKRARCYICKERGHVFWKCQNKRKDARIEKQKESVKPTYKNVAEKINAYKNHMCPTRSLFKKLKYKFNMIEKEETEKKFIFSYGVGDITVEAREGNFVIINVHYTPEVTLNVLSLDLLEEQGYIVKISNNKCNLHYMFDEARTRKAQEERFIEDDGLKDVVIEHNKFLDKYFESIEPKDEGLLVKGLEDKKCVKMLKWFYLAHLNYDILEGIPPVIGVMEINLLSLHKTVDNLGGYLYATLGDKWRTIANLQGLTDDDGEVVKGCYKKFIDMVQVHYETAKMPWYEKKPK